GEPTVGDIPWTHDEDDLPDAIAMQAKKREKMGAVPGDTVHFDIVDKAGNMVSSTPSGGWLHSSPVIPELGFCLGTRAQMFWLEEGHPASLAPGKRPRSTLTPTMALRDGEPYLAWGSPGGDRAGQYAGCGGDASGRGADSPGQVSVYGRRCLSPHQTALRRGKEQIGA